ncbi:uncharacterized protein LOC123672004 [Harmonia axyridis]|uniref:uncharacterized protein LOC123672004 n=1 Tax=Harmonia axyridis TaxID=115357 RepID=UPI001E277A50|nr:uncharacterized protein LOC123672004 [Harmonia axyridis]
MDSTLELRNKRGVIKAQLTRFTTFLNNISDKKITELPDRLLKCEELWDVFESIQSQIEVIDERELDSNERQTFEDSFYDTVSRAKEILSNSTQHNAKTTVNNQPISEHVPLVSSTIKLPTLELPHFNGAYDQWIQFRDTFKSLIHTSTTLSNIQKFHYLQSCLKDEAAQIIHSLEICDKNYETAWKLLQERFENKRLIVHKHIRSLFELEPLTKDSLTLLRKLSDDVKKNLRALKSLDLPTESWDALLIYMISSKFDPSTKMEWEKTIVSNTLPDMEQLYGFLAQRCQILETIASCKPVNTSKGINSLEQGYKSRTNKNNFSKSFLSTNQSNSCPFCKQAHYLYQCQKFIDLPSKSKYNEVKQLKLCINCLRSNHFSPDCHASGCKKCGRKHNTLLHSESFERKYSNRSNHLESNNNQSNLHADQASTSHQREKTESSISTHCSFNQSQILLSTALVYAIDKYNQPHEVRVLLDSGSMKNFITSDMCNILHWPKQKINSSISGINETVTSSTYMTQGTIKSKFNHFKLNTTFVVLDKITDNLPIKKLNINELKIPDNLTLADNSFNVPAPIEMLLGVTVFYDLLCVGQIRLQRGHPIMQKTKLGWIISGSLFSTPKPNYDEVSVCNLSTDSIGQQLEKFWVMEDYDNRPRLNKEERECEINFIQSTKREEDGRFSVTLPTREKISELGSSYETAVRRFDMLEAKFRKNVNFKKQYTEFMNEYIELGHMKKLAQNKENHNERNVFYLPHHGVFKDGSETTKLRIVFDGSCKTDTGISLNDCLHVGPTLQDDLFTILIRFRQHNIVISADICKMYRQVYVQEEQRDLQRILWRAEPSKPIDTYVLNTVTYGTSPAAFLAIRSLQQVGLDKRKNYPVASNMILNDFYVDDLLSGGNSVQEVKQARADLIKILGEYGFVLRKWMSNKQEVLTLNYYTKIL